MEAMTTDEEEARARVIAKRREKEEEKKRKREEEREKREERRREKREKKEEERARRSEGKKKKDKAKGGVWCCATPSKVVEEEGASGADDVVIASSVKPTGADSVPASDGDGAAAKIATARGTEPEHAADIRRLNQELQGPMLGDDGEASKAVGVEAAEEASLGGGGSDDASMSTLDRLFSAKSAIAGGPINEEAHEISKLQKSSRHTLLILGALMFQAGLIYIAIALVRTLGNVYLDLTSLHKSRGIPSGGVLSVLAHVIVVYGMDVVGESLMGYVFVVFSKVFAKVAVMPGRDVTSLATIELASVFHRFRFILLFVCLWTTYDLFLLPTIGVGSAVK